MGLSIVISGAIIFVALMYALMTIPNVLDSILLVDEASSEISVLEDSISQTEMSIDSIEAAIGSSKVNFTLTNDGNEKLWNYEKFDLLITYDADIAGVKTRITEELTYVNIDDGIPGVPIVFDDVTSFNGNCGGTGDECTIAHTVNPAGTDTILIVGVTPKGSQTVSSVTYDSLPLTEIRSDDDGGVVVSSLWYRLSPSTGPNTVEVTLSASEEVVIGAMSFTGVDQVSPIDDDNGDIGNNDTPTVSLVTTECDARIVDVVSTLDGPLTEGAGQTERWDRNEGSTAGGGSTEITTTPGSRTMSWTNIGGTKEWAISAAALKPTFPICPPETLIAKHWTVNSITPDVLDPGLINNQEQAEILTQTSFPIFPGGIVIIKISSDNGVTSSFSEVP